MKIVIDNGGVVSDVTALQMVVKILENKPDATDCTVKFSNNLAVTIKTSKTQRAYTVGKSDT